MQAIEQVVSGLSKTPHKSRVSYQSWNKWYDKKQTECKHMEDDDAGSNKIQSSGSHQKNWRKRKLQRLGGVEHQTSTTSRKFRFFQSANNRLTMLVLSPTGFSFLMYNRGQLAGWRGIAQLDQGILRMNQTLACTVTGEAALRNSTLKTANTTQRLLLACK